MENPFLPQLQELLPDGAVRTDSDTLNTWGQDWTRSYTVAPSAVVFPETVEQVSEVVRWAAANGVGLVPSGGRTGLSGGAVASNGEVVVSLDRMNRIRDFDPIDQLVTCGAGVTTGALHAFAEEKGLFYPVDFAASGSSQIGGNIATNAGGIRVIRYGMTRDWVAGLTVVTGTGDILTLNQGLRKNATGYDLRHLFVGSEGTLGIIVEAQIQLTRPPLPQSVLVLGTPNMSAILNVLTVFQRDLELSAFEFYSHNSVEKVVAARDIPFPLSEPSPFYVLIEFDEERGEAALGAFEECMEQELVTDGVMSQSSEQATALWATREGISEAIAPRGPYKNDVSVRPSRMADFLEAAEALVSSSYPDFEVCWYGHIGDGNLHLNLLPPEGMDPGTFYDTCHGLSPELFALVREREGSISAEHGVGLLKRDYLGYSRSDEELRIMKAMKDVFDPAGIMNPGKVF